MSGHYRSVFAPGLFAGEVRRMIATRRKRLAVWLLALGGVAAAGCLIDIEREADIDPLQVVLLRPLHDERLARRHRGNPILNDA